jgi:hypothetical protein
MPGHPPWLDFLDPYSLEEMKKAYDASKQPGAPLFPQDKGNVGQGSLGSGAVLGKQPTRSPVDEPLDESLPNVPRVKSDSGGAEDTAGKIIGGLETDNTLYAKPQLPQNPGVPVPAQSHEWRVGGPGTLQKIFKTDVDRTAQAVREGAEATAKEATETEHFYQTERQREGDAAAVREAHRQEYIDQIQKRQQEIDQNVKKYSEDLADTGKFWRNPGNILAAFGAAVMDMGMHGQATGWKMIQSAIRNDLYQRHKLAEMHLGELRSNLTGYRQLAQDNQAGDLIAEAEANRIAALQLKEISSRFQGKKAQSAAETYIAELMQRHDMLWAQWYEHIVTNPHLGNKMIEDLMKKAGSQEIQNSAVQGQAQGPMGAELPGAQPEVPPNPYGPETQAAAPGKTPLTPLQQKALGAFSQGVQPFKQRINQMFPGSNDPEVYQGRPIPEGVAPGPKAPVPEPDKRMAGATGLAKRLNESLIRQAKGSKGIWDHASEVKFDALRAQDDKDLFEIGKVENVARTAKNVKLVGNLQQQMSAFEQAAKAYGKDPQDLWGSLRNLTGDSLANKIRQITGNSDFTGKASTPEAKQAKRLFDSSEAMHQLVSLNVNEYLQNNGGKALTDKEIEEYSSVVGKAQNWDYIRRGVGLLSKSTATGLDSYLSGANPRVILRYKVQNGITPTQADIAGLGE